MSKFDFISFKTSENISKDFSFVLYVGSVSFWFCIFYYFSFLEFPKAEAAESIIHLPCGWLFVESTIQELSYLWTLRG